MSDNKLVKMLMDAATLTGFAAGIGWIAKKVAKEKFNFDPSGSAINYVEIYCGDGRQHHALTVSGGPKNTPCQCL